MAIRPGGVRLLVAVLGSFASLTACIDTPVTECAGGRICPAGTVCDEVRDGCVLPAQVTNCDGRADLMACSYPGVADGACYDGVCLPAGCGNGIEDPDEVCDDGNRVHGDGCSADCRSDERCGNNVIDLPVGESCDDGNRVDGDGCRADCVAISCGDGIKDAEAFEECDGGDDNSNAPDAACRLNCLARRCGDGVVDPAFQEECDDGNIVPGDGCAGTCQWEVCGNGHIDLRPEGQGFVPTEECDDGNALSLDGCSPTCRFVGGTWEHADTPFRRDAHAMAYDAGRGRLVMFGGLETSYRADTWEWDGHGWIDHTPTDESASPSARGNHAMVYDAVRRRVILFGGFGNGARGDTYEWNGTEWSNRTPPAPTDSPPGRSLHAMAYDSGRDRVVVFGGLASGNRGDTWEWDGTVWRDVSPSGTPGVDVPSARHGHAMTFDPTRGRVVLFGGFDAGRLSDTWEWNGTAWTEVTPIGPSQSPSERSNHHMTFDARRGVTVLFGGYTASTRNDTWTWNGSQWTDVTPAAAGDSPPARELHALAYDAAAQRVVLFGGASITNNDDTWTWDGTRWTRAATSPTAPTPRGSHAVTYVSDRGEIILFGGSDGSTRNDTWAWRGQHWVDVTPASPSNSPPPLEQHALAYDAARRRVVLFGGRAPSATNVTWEWDGMRWQNVTPTGGSPPARYRHALAYDVVRARTVLFGGYNGAYLSDTWTWDGTTWRDATPPSPTDSPAGRFRHTLTYDAARQRVVLFGGSAVSLRRDTWEWDGAAWVDVTPASSDESPPARFGHVAAYDAALQRLVVFGGHDGASDLADTWERDGATWTRVASGLGQSVPPGGLGAAMEYDAARGRTVLFGGYSGGAFVADTWRYAHRAAGPQSCLGGLDDDGDGDAGCDDPDCWGYCTPLCPPGAPCDAAAPRCGDGTCNTALESCRSCPADCPPCQAVCGDFLCDPPENASTCPGDC